VVKLWILSDLHQEYGETEWLGPIPEHDVVVLAGDIHQTPAEGISDAEKMFTKPVIYVAGNHEFWEKNIDDEIAKGKQLSRQSSMVHFLENDDVVIGGVHFIGATLWTDFLLFGEDKEKLCRREASLSILDYNIIRENTGEPAIPSRKFSPLRSKVRHAASLEFIREAFGRHLSLPKVVVTHHAPHPGSVIPQYLEDWVSAAFASDLSSLIREHHPQLWVHGHVHATLDYQEGKTRIVCNALGDDTGNFRSNLIVDVVGALV
jgi:Icc-related predicted phosphoesterase